MAAIMNKFNTPRLVDIKAALGLATARAKERCESEEWQHPVGKFSRRTLNVVVVRHKSDADWAVNYVYQPNKHCSLPFKSQVFWEVPWDGSMKQIKGLLVEAYNALSEDEGESIVITVERGFLFDKAWPAENAVVAVWPKLAVLEEYTKGGDMNHGLMEWAKTLSEAHQQRREQ